MTLLRERTEIREVPKLQRPRRPWFGWIVSLVVLVVAGGIWLMVRDTGTSLDGSFEANEQARFERIGAAAAEVAPVRDGFDLAETQRFEGLGTEPASELTNQAELPTFDRHELAQAARIRAQGLNEALPAGEVCFSVWDRRMGWG